MPRALVTFNLRLWRAQRRPLPSVAASLLAVRSTVTLLRSVPLVVVAAAVAVVSLGLGRLARTLLHSQPHVFSAITAADAACLM